MSGLEFEGIQAYRISTSRTSTSHHQRMNVVDHSIIGGVCLLAFLEGGGTTQEVGTQFMNCQPTNQELSFQAV